MKAALARLKGTHGYRSWLRYGDARGGVLAGGIAYFAFFSVFPALTLGFAIFGFVLRGHPSLFHDVVHSISGTLPGVVKDSTHPDGVIDASKPPTPNALTITGAVSLVILVLSGLGWLSTLREGIRAMFGRPLYKANPVTGRLRDLAIFGFLGLAMLVSAVLGAGANTATGRVLGWLGIASDSVGGRVVLPLVGFVVVLAVDTGIYLVLLRLLSGVRLAWVHLRTAAFVGALGAGVLKVAVAYGILGSSTNPLLASFAIVVGLLLVMNLLSRVTLLAAAWAATTAEAAGALVAEPVVVPAVSPVPPVKDVGTAAMEPTFGERSADRTAVAAGAVLGAVTAVGFGAVRRAVSAGVAAIRAR